MSNGEQRPAVVSILERERPGWMAVAECKGLTHLFFPPPGERPQTRARREVQASAICAGCPARAECREWARDNREYGFWGGESEEERASAGFAGPATIGRRTRQAAASFADQIA